MDPSMNELVMELDHAFELLSSLTIERYYTTDDEAPTLTDSSRNESPPLKQEKEGTWKAIPKNRQSVRNAGNRKSIMGAKPLSHSLTPKLPKRNTESTTRSLTCSEQMSIPSTKGWAIKQSKTTGKVPEKAPERKRNLSKVEEDKQFQVSITIVSAENLPKCEVMSPYIIGFFDPDDSFRTRIRFNTAQPMWGEVFEVDLPKEPKELCFTLWNHYSPKRQDFLGTGFLPFSKNNPIEDIIWVNIENTDNGEVPYAQDITTRIQIKYTTIEMDTRGDPLIDLLIAEKTLSTVIYHWIEEKKMDIPAFSMVELFHSRHSARELLSNIVEHSKSLPALLNKSSVLRKMIGVFCKYSRDSYMNIFQPLFIEMEDNQIQLEVRASYLHKTIKRTNKEVIDQQQKNKQNLIKYATAFIQTIESSIHDLNQDIRLFSRKVHSVLPPDSLHEVLGDIIFQKYLCPVIASPVAFGLLRDSEQSQQQTQSNIVLAKVLVNMATNRLFPESNELSVMNDFIQSRSKEFEELYNSICSEHSSFRMVLKSSKQREAFRKHLESRYCTENLEFWEDIQEYLNMGDTDRQSYATVIWKLYFKEGAERELNVDSKVVQQIKQKLAEAPIDLFSDALSHILHLLQTDSFHKFCSNRRTTIISGQQIHQKVRVKCLTDTCRFLLENRGSIRQFASNFDEADALYSAIDKLDNVINSLSVDYNPHVDVEILNRAQKWAKLPRAAWTVAASLLKTLVDIYKKYFMSSGAVTDESIRELATSEEFSLFLNACAELQVVKVHSLSSNQKLAFWLNTYNLLTLHAYISVGQPNCKKTWLNFQRYCCYDIDGKVYSLFEIEHCVLRGGMAPTKWIGTVSPVQIKFGPTDERASSVYTKSFPQLSFVIGNGMNSIPIIHVYTPGSLHKEIEEVIQRFLIQNFALNLISIKELHVPFVVKWVSKDTGKEKRKLLRKLVHTWPDNVPQKHHIVQALKSHAFKVIVDEPTWVFLPVFE